jgi:hypothetical protein
MLLPSPPPPHHLNLQKRIRIWERSDTVVVVVVARRGADSAVRMTDSVKLQSNYTHILYFSALVQYLQ